MNTIFKRTLRSTGVKYENVIRLIYNAYQPVTKLQLALSNSNIGLDREMYAHIVSGNFMGPYVDCMSAYLYFIIRSMQYNRFANILSEYSTEISAGTLQLTAFLFDLYLKTRSNHCLNHLLHYNLWVLVNMKYLPCEPLHGISGHIKNLYDELPSHLNKTEKNYFNETVVA